MSSIFYIMTNANGGDLMKTMSKKYSRRIRWANFLEKTAPIITIVAFVSFILAMILNREHSKVFWIFILNYFCLGVPVIIIPYLCIVPKVKRMLRNLEENDFSNEMILLEIDNAKFVGKSRKLGYSEHLLIVKSFVFPIKTISSIKCMRGAFDTRVIINIENNKCKAFNLGILHGFFAHDVVNNVSRLVQRIYKDHSIIIRCTYEEIDYSD